MSITNTNAVQVFNFEGAAKVRTVIIGEEIWFVAKDVCDVLGYTNHRKAASDHCKGVTKCYPLQTAGGKQEIRILSEADVMRLICSSKLPAAQRFERWVFEVVLPSIRKTGKYEAPAAPEDEQILVAKAFAIIHRQLTDSKALVEKLEKQIEEDGPNVKFAKDILATQNGMAIGEAAKLIHKATGIELGQNRFFKYLLDRGYLHKGGAQYGLPTQKSIETGILAIKIYPSGKFRRDVAIVTAKGLQYFINRFNKDREFLNFLFPEGFAK